MKCEERVRTEVVTLVCDERETLRETEDGRERVREYVRLGGDGRESRGRDGGRREI